MLLRNGVILTLTTLGVLLLTWAAHDEGTARVALGLGCWGLAATYAVLTGGRR